MYFSSLHGQALDFSPFSSGAPTVCRHGTYVAVLAEHVERAPCPSGS